MEYKATCGVCSSSWSNPEDPKRSVICPDCKGNGLVGVLNFEPAKPNYEALTAERDQLRAERDAATARAEAAEKELERCLLAAAPDAQLPIVTSDRAEYVLAVAVSVVISAIRVGDLQASQRRAAESTAADLRAALEEVLKYEGEYIDSQTAEIIKAALSRTPAHSLAKCKAEALKTAINTFPNIEGGELWETSFMAWVLHEADRLEKEAANDPR